MPLLHVAVASDLLGNAGNLDGLLQVARIETLQQLLDALPILHDQRALGLAFLGAAEYVEGRAPQALQAGQQAEGLEHPRAVLALLQLALLVALGSERRSEVVVELVVALELLGDLRAEALVAVQPGNLVLVL